MEKEREMPPPYNPEGYGYQPPQNPPAYNQPGHQAGYPYPHQPPQPHMTNPGPAPAPVFNLQHQQYPNVVIQQPVFNPAVRAPPPPDHMSSAIFVTLCCFWPTGIIAIIKANEAKNAWLRGDSVLANNSARTAKNMVTVSLVAGICSIVVLAIIIGLYWGVFLSSYNGDDDDDDYYN